MTLGVFLQRLVLPLAFARQNISALRSVLRVVSMRLIVPQIQYGTPRLVLEGFSVVESSILRSHGLEGG